jgi:ferredoxin
MPKKTIIPKKTPMPEQPAEERIHNYNEVPYGYAEEQARAEAKRCLECAKPSSASQAAPSPVVQRPLITFVKTGRTIQWDGESPSLLDFAEAQGFSPDFSCRSGICSTCKTGLISGRVEYTETPLDPPDEHQVLLCCSRPLNDVELDL